MARSKIDALMGDKKLSPETLDAKKTTILLDAQDEEEIFRIQEVLRSNGIIVNEHTQIIRLALRDAFKDLKQEEIEEIQDIHEALSTKWKRGKR